MKILAGILLFMVLKLPVWAVPVDLLLLHGHCWHRVLRVHGGSRYSLNHRAGPAGVQAGVTDICVYRNMRYRFSTAEVLIDRLAL